MVLSGQACGKRGLKVTPEEWTEKKKEIQIRVYSSENHKPSEIRHLWLRPPQNAGWRGAFVVHVVAPALFNGRSGTMEASWGSLEHRGGEGDEENDESGTEPEG